MNSKITLVITTTMIMLSMQSCFSPQSIVKLQPDKENVKWRYGQQFVADSLKGIIYEVGYDQMNDNSYWFDFSIINRSNIPILIDPVDFKCQALDGAKNPFTEHPVAAIDPESEILQLEKDLAKAEAREVNHIGLSLLAASVDLASGIAVATDDNPYNNHLHTNLFYDVQAGREENKFKTQNLNELMDAWKRSTIRKTTLEPNFEIQGKVFFPAFRDASFIILYLPVDDKRIKMTFKQLQIPVK